MANPARTPLTLTAAALERVKVLLAQRERPALGIRIGVKAKGCTGLSYTLEYTEERHPSDEIVQAQGVTLFIDPTAIIYILGTEMDYIEGKLEAGFVFRNPNQKGQCGCGKSFYV